MQSDKLHIWATPFYSPIEISASLTYLRVSHSIGKKNKLRHKRLGFAQPMAVHIGTTIDSLLVGAVNFIVAPASQLALTNYPLFTSGPLEDSLRVMLTSSRAVTPRVQKLTELDYVDIVAKPSTLSNILSAINRVNPYDFRKECLAQVLAYLSSEVSERTIQRFISKSLKLEPIRDMLVAAAPIREAVARAATGENSEKLGEEYSIPAFEINYVMSKRRKKC